MGSNPTGGTGREHLNAVMRDCPSVGYLVFMQSSNPILHRYESVKPGTAQAVSAGGAGLLAPQTMTQGVPPMDTTGVQVKMTLNDVVFKCMLIFAINVAFAFVGWQVAEAAPIVWIVAVIASLGLGLANSFMRRINVALVIGYAIASGIMVGAISNFYSEFFSSNENLILQAVIGTMTAFGVMLFLYATGIVKVTKKFVRVLMAAMISYLVIALASFVGALFGLGDGWGFYGVGGWGLLLCAAGVLIASFSLMLDFEAIKQGINMGIEERESWRMAFGLLVTLVWLYLEILRFLAIFGGRE